MSYELSDYDAAATLAAAKSIIEGKALEMLLASPVYLMARFIRAGIIRDDFNEVNAMVFDAVADWNANLDRIKEVVSQGGYTGDEAILHRQATLRLWVKGALDAGGVHRGGCWNDGRIITAISAGTFKHTDALIEQIVFNLIALRPKEAQIAA